MPAARSSPRKKASAAPAEKGSEPTTKSKAPQTKTKSNGKVAAVKNTSEPEVVSNDVKKAASKSNSKNGTSKEKTVKAEPAAEDEVKPSPAKGKRKRAAEKPSGKEEEPNSAEAAEEAAKPKGRKKAKTDEAMAAPLAARTANVTRYVGAHVSCAGGVQTGVTNALRIGGNSFAMFLKSQRKWANPDLKEEDREVFHARCGEHKYDATKHIVPHGSYLVNLASAKEELAKQSYDCFLDDIKRCDRLGIKLYNFHPGNTNGEPRNEAIGRIADAINRAHKAVPGPVTALLENMASRSNVIGGTFEDLRDVISLIKDKSRIGVCLDTCHAFASGYDIRSEKAWSETMDQFEKVIGLKYLMALHMNDSKAPFESCRDLHANIGTGFIGLRGFWNVMNDERLAGLPMVLETPTEDPDDKSEKPAEGEKDDKKDKKSKAVVQQEESSKYAREIKLLESLTGMDPNGKEFLEFEKKLSDAGAKERAKHQTTHDKKVEKNAKQQSKLDFGGGAKGKKKGKGKKAAADEDESDAADESD